MSVSIKNFPINPSAFQWINGEADPNEWKVHDWIRPYNEDDNIEWDVVLFGVPLSRSSISASGASEFPESFRRSWRGFSTYNMDMDVDLSALKICDLGDVSMHITDIPKSHENIKNAMIGVRNLFPRSLTIAIGGDHSITAMLVKGINEVTKGKRIGILQFDTHLDLRDLKDHGPTNGTPIRNLIEHEIVQGENVYNIGLHGFFNTRSLVNYAKEKGINMVTLNKARKLGIENTVKQCLKELSDKTDIIYVTCDMDVLDIGNAPGVPASTPGGMHSFELFEALAIAGAHPKVESFDIVCLDPLKDTVQQTTVKAGTHAFLSFLSGYIKRRYPM